MVKAGYVKFGGCMAAAQAVCCSCHRSHFRHQANRDNPEASYPDGDGATCAVQLPQSAGCVRG